MQDNMAYGSTQLSDLSSDENHVYEIPQTPDCQRVKFGKEVVQEQPATALDCCNSKNFKSKVQVRWFEVVSMCAALLAALAVLLVFILPTTQHSSQSQDKTIDALLFQLSTLQENVSAQKQEIDLCKSDLQEALNNTADTLHKELSILHENLSTEIKICKSEVQDLQEALNQTIHDVSVVHKNISKQLNEISSVITPSEVCGGPGWRRVAFINMTDSTQQCPDGLNLITRTEPPLRTCGRSDSVEECASVTFSVHGIQYSHVCGRVIGYQIGSPDAFEYFNAHSQTTIDDHYLDGISLTYGRSPRQHIWSFVGAYSEIFPDLNTCPCTHGRNHNYTASLPPFIGDDYFCDTAVRGSYASDGEFHPDDPLWDGRGCGSNSICCEFNNPPWFHKQLPQPTADNIELRICTDEVMSNEDLPIEMVQVYVN